jgi:glucose/arabinose dehydrogenase
MLRRIVASVAVLLILSGLPAMNVTQEMHAQTGERCFAETGFCITGRLRTFWEQNGGLPVFGFPITPERTEIIEGRARQVQWFERVRLELHPENAPPYDVLLGRLGAERATQADTTEQVEGECRTFGETGFAACGAILRAWRANGLEFDGRPGLSEAENLALFGLPLGAPHRTTLSDGKIYTVQWFERGRFELHPENAPPYDVLLGLLGREALLAEIVKPPPPLPPPDPLIPPPDDASAQLRAPAGFLVREFVAGLDKPRLMTVGPDGALYVAERGAGRIVRLPDANGDERADRVEPVLSGLLAPHNMEWIDGCLYVAENDKVLRHCDTSGDGRLDQSAMIVGLPVQGGGHTSRTLHLGPDGKLYVAAGSSCNVCAEQDPRRATMMRFNLDGSIPADNPFANDPNPLRRAVWAEGLRNSIDFVFMPDGQLWANHNGRDNMINQQVKNDKPLEELIIAVQRGRYHGWPYCTSERPDGGLEAGPGPYIETPDPSGDVPPAPAGFVCADAVPALFTSLAHTAPIGITRYDGANFPESYRGDIFVALHGSWNRTPPAPCVVQRVRVENGQPVGAEDFLTGFQRNANQPCAAAWGRPAGVITGADGALYVSDDLNGRIYRVVWQGER